MPKPHETIATDALVLTVRSTADWYETWKQPLADSLNGTADRAAEGRALGDELESAHTVVEKEKRDDVAATNVRDQAVVDGRRVVRAARAGADLVFRHDPNYEDIRNDFGAVAPSRMRTASVTREQLRAVTQALSTHKDALAERIKNVDEQIARAESLHATLGEWMQNHAKENNETSAAMLERDRLRTAAFDYIDQAQAEAEFLAVDYPDALTALRVIFDTHNPASPASGGDAPTPNDDVVDEPVVAE